MQATKVFEIRLGSKGSAKEEADVRSRGQPKVLQNEYLSWRDQQKVSCNLLLPLDFSI